MVSPSREPVRLAEVLRGDKVESFHAGSIAVCDSSGGVLWQMGAADEPTFLRSSAKPFQAYVIAALGTLERYHFTDEELALICASHGGQALHLPHVFSMLAKCGATAQQLRCGPHEPLHKGAAAELWRHGESPGRIHNNCSGKHAGMLAACLHQGWPVTSYWEFDHPLQLATRKTLAEFCRMHVDDLAMAIDGCGVPTFYLSMVQAATAFARLTNPVGPEAVFCRKITRAMTNYPLLISREGGFNAELVRLGQGAILAKSGAEGLFCLGLVDQGIGIAIKIADGSDRGVPAIVYELLRRYRPAMINEDLYHKLHEPLRNSCGDEVARIRACFTVS